MSRPRHRVLVVGCGSIGERHIRTFLATDRAEVVGCDCRSAVGEQMATRYGVAVSSDWRSACVESGITALVIATPASSHLEMALHALESGRHVLIEKPLALALPGTERLLAARDRGGLFTAVGYVRHCLPTLRAAREFIRSGEFGTVRHATVATGEHFPTARPSYREIYYCDHAKGGGAIQDALTHLANAVEWILGPTQRLYCDAAHQALEGVEVEDTVNIVARNGAALVCYTLNQFQAPVEMRLDFHAEGGSIRLELPERWGTYRRNESGWSWRPAAAMDRDGLFTAQANEFLDGCEGRPTQLCSLEEGIQSLRFNLAALRSWRERLPVSLDAMPDVRRSAGASPSTASAGDA